jgi:hypothetical protein
MNSLTVIESWIASVLLADVTITGLVGDNIFLGEADQKSTSPLIVYNYVDGSPFYTLGTKRDFTVAEYDIRAYQSGYSTATVKSLANQIDELFKAQRNVVYQGYWMHSRTMKELSFVENDEAGTYWRMLGGTYRISATKI